MLLALVSLLLIGQQKPQTATYKILFLGNSHTAYNDLTGQVASLLRSNGSKVEFSMMTGGHLDDLEKQASVRSAIDGGKWTHVVLQGAMISSSHKYEYSQAAGISLAARAKRAGAKALLFAEWPRKGWAESDYIFKHYEIIQKAAGGDVLPVCYAWDEAVKTYPKLELWNPDGNHSNATGAHSAACTIAYWIAGPDSSLKYVPSGVDPKTASLLMQTAKVAVEKRKKL